MLHPLRLASVALLLLCCAPCALAQEPGDIFHSLPTRPGVTVPLALIDTQRPKAAVLLLAGGNGSLGITSDGGAAGGGAAKLARGGNFLVRSRRLFAAHGLAVAVMDAPSDYAAGMGGRFRLSEGHLADLRAVVAFLTQRWGLKPWVVGTSMGSLSAGWAAANLGSDIAGVGLTSSVTRVGKRWDMPAAFERGTLSAGLAKVVVPALVVRHRDDGCAFSQPSDAPLILEALTSAPRKELLTVAGGLPAQSAECEARSAHGYLGVEEQAVAGIAAFMLGGGAKN
jgi:hypothetical protein